MGREDHFYCIVCGAEFRDGEQFDTHSKDHDCCHGEVGNILYDNGRCRQCGFIYQCPICGKEFGDILELNIYELSHLLSMRILQRRVQRHTGFYRAHEIRTSLLSWNHYLCQRCMFYLWSYHRTFHTAIETVRIRMNSMENPI